MKRKSSNRNSSRQDASHLEGIPNVGPAIAADFRQLGITSPSELSGRDPYTMYDDLCRITGKPHDPCLLDTFIAAVRYMEGGPEEAVVRVHGGTEENLGGSNSAEVVGLKAATQSATAQSQWLKGRTSFRLGK